MSQQGPRWLTWLRDRLWSTSAVEGPDVWYRRWLLLTQRSLYLVIDSLRRADVQQRASALTMVTLLSLVPALAVAFSVLTAFASLRDVGARIRAYVVQELAVTGDTTVADKLGEFIQNTNAGALGGVGTLLLVVSSISLLITIENAFNDVWGVKRGRTYVQRFQVYWPLMTLGPMLVAVSVSLSLTVIKYAPWLKWLSGLAPFVASGLFFFLLYKIMPNARVRTVPALLGGAVAGALWLLAQKLFALYATNAISYSAIYGSLGAIPLFILSVQLSWLVVLFGAQLVFAIQTVRSSEVPGGASIELSVRDRERLALLLDWRVVHAYEQGTGPTRVSDLIEYAGWPPTAVRMVLADLLATGLILEVEQGDVEDPAYVPARPSTQRTLCDVVDAIRGSTRVTSVEGTLPDEDRSVLDRYTQAEQAFLRRLGEAPGSG